MPLASRPDLTSFAACLRASHCEAPAGVQGCHGLQWLVAQVALCNDAGRAPFVKFTGDRDHGMKNDATDPDSEAGRQPDDKIPVLLASGLAMQLACLVLPGAVMIPTVVFRAAGQPEDVLLWAVFASVAACGATTIIQARRFGRIGAGYILAIGTSGAAIAVSIAATRRRWPGAACQPGHSSSHWSSSCSPHDFRCSGAFSRRPSRGRS